MSAYIYEILFLQLKLNRMRLKVTWLTQCTRLEKWTTLKAKLYYHIFREYIKQVNKH